MHQRPHRPIAEITGGHGHVALGTDFDGFIKPTIGGLETLADLARLSSALIARYGASDAERPAGRATRSDAATALR